MKKIYQVTVVYPVYVEVEADNQEEAEQKALERAEQLFQVSSMDPVIHEISENK